jgi:hypothetical protein
MNGDIIGEIHAYAESRNGEVLYLFYTDYNHSPEIKTKSNSDSQTSINRPQGFYNQAVRCAYSEQDSSSPEYKALKYIYDNIQKLNENLQEIAKNVLVLSFDNLAIEQLQNIHAVVGEDWDTFYMGDDGNYTFYIDLVAGTFAKNSCIDERFPIGDKSMDDMFNFIRDKYGVKKVA